MFGERFPIFQGFGETYAIFWLQQVKWTHAIAQRAQQPESEKMDALKDDDFLGRVGFRYMCPTLKLWLATSWAKAWALRGYTRRTTAPPAPSFDDIAFAICGVPPPLAHVNIYYCNISLSFPKCFVNIIFML